MIRSDDEQNDVVSMEERRRGRRLQEARELLVGGEEGGEALLGRVAQVIAGLAQVQNATASLFTREPDWLKHRGNLGELSNDIERLATEVVRASGGDPLLRSGLPERGSDDARAFARRSCSEWIRGILKDAACALAAAHEGGQPSRAEKLREVIRMIEGEAHNNKEG